MVTKIHKNSKFTKEQIEYIMENYGKKSSKELAKEFTVTYGTINNIIRRYGGKLMYSRTLYTTEQLVEEALKYTSVKEFNENNTRMCSAARARGIIKQLRESGHFKVLGNVAHKFVYVYFLTNNRVYVGQTCNLERRHKEHVYDRLKEDEITIKKVSKLLEVNRATKLEEALRLRYIKLGYNVLNKTTCTSVGSTIRKWTKESCIVEAKKYKNRKEWQHINSSSYNAAWKNGWLDDCIHVIPPGKRVQNLDTGEIFESARAASRWLGQNKHAVSKAIKEKHRCGGYRWKFVY